jgi:hypothetical protein
VPRPSLWNLSRPAVLALAMLVWLSSPMGARPAQAVGCHGPERPVLAMRLSWDRAGRLEAWAMTADRPLAPPVLARVPCPGEVPQVPVASIASIGAAVLAAVEIAPPIRRESLPATDNIGRREPHPHRLDRPPR